MTDICIVEVLGMLAYAQAWEYQKRLSAQIARGERPPTLLLLEHPHTYTFGRRGQAENLLWDEAELQRRGVAVYWVDRGGDVTYHGPGQLVGYPLLPLGGVYTVSETEGSKPENKPIPHADYVGYVRRLEQIIIQALLALDVQAHTLAGQTGVWVDGKQWSAPAKIAAIGVKVDVNGVTQHGFALNVNPDMSYWQGIIACGLKDAPAASLAELLDPLPDFETVYRAVISAFGAVFDYQMIEA